METLSLALYSEGPTDSRFLPPVIVNTARYILDKHHQRETGISAIHLIEVKNKKRRAEAILQAAIAASDYHALIIHADADHPSAEKARIERFEPGLQLVQRAKGDRCRSLLPIIPVQATEAWMLADYELLLAEIGTTLTPTKLGIPTNPELVESIVNPKNKLKEVVRAAYASRTKRRRKSDIDFLYEPIGDRISLERLKQVPSYQEFVVDLTETLVTLNFIPRMHRL
jgi:hypothetical protein